MKKITITYTDYNDNERTEDFYFNLTKAEIAEMQLSTSGGLAEMIQNIISTQDVPAIIKIFKELIFKSYGVKSPDGREFIKSEELSRKFSQTEAYSQLYMGMIQDPDKAADFVNGIIPKDLAAQLAETNPKAIIESESM